MKHFVVIFLIIAFSWIFVTMPVLAHVLQADGTIGAVLHVDPDDDPVAKEDSSFFFEFKDTSHIFSLADCICTVAIDSNANTIYKTTLNTTPVVTFVFPERGVYTIRVTGASISHRFNPFTLSYVVRVDRESASPRQTTSLGATIIYHIVHYGIFVIGFIILIWLVMREKRHNKKSVTKKV